MVSVVAATYCGYFYYQYIKLYMNKFFPHKNDKLGWACCIVGFTSAILDFSVIIADVIIKLSN